LDVLRNVMHRLQRSDCTFQPPNGLARLTLPDVNASGTWSGFYDAANRSFTENGDTNFSFQMTGSPLQAPGFHAASRGDLIDNLAFDITFASSPSSLALAVVYDAAENDVCIRQGCIPLPAPCPSPFGQFFVATVFSLVGCNFTQCQITGNWMLSFVREPSSLASLAGAVGGFLFPVLFSRKPREGRGAGLRLRLAG